MNCNYSSPKIFSNIALSFYDSDGKSMPLNVHTTVTFLKDEYVQCDTNGQQNNLICECDNIEIFNIKISTA